MVVDTRALRAILGCFATGVAIITARDGEDTPVGVTVNSFASVSLDPPLVLFSLAKRANILTIFQQTECFAVSFLSHEQEALSNTFAKPSSASWPESGVVQARNGCPLFKDSLAYLECNKATELDGGDHRIFLGEITHFAGRDNTDPLLFYRGRYGTYARDTVNRQQKSEGSLLDFSMGGWG
jgi:3-hydroxy-9,10-secoandrosta-1,3,5(10)-triene-9,17-dione monooxygenase reductase component